MVNIDFSRGLKEFEKCSKNRESISLLITRWRTKKVNENEICSVGVDVTGSEEDWSLMKADMNAK